LYQEERRRVNGEGEGCKYTGCVLYFYENRKMKLVEIVLRRGQKDEGE
jgi:hypothetical protein